MSVLLIHSHYGPTPAPFATAVTEGLVRCVREQQLTVADFDNADGLITTCHLDQIGFMAHRPAVEALLARP